MGKGKSKTPKSLLKSIKKIEDSNGDDSVLDQGIPSKIKRFLAFQKRRGVDLDGGHSMESISDLNEKNSSLKGESLKGASKSVSQQSKSVSQQTSVSGTKQQNALDSQHQYKVGKVVTKKSIKRKNYLESRKQKSIVLEHYKANGLEIEQQLREKQKIKFGDRAMEPPSLTAIPKMKGKVVVLDTPKDTTSTATTITDQDKKKNNPLEYDGKSVGRARKLKTLSEAERKSLLAEREKLIALYRAKKSGK